MSEELRAAIVQDEQSGRVLMLGWMDDEALALTKSTGLVHFFSRSRQRLWKKGETSGNVFHVTSVEPDCDEDAVLVSVHAEGPACHDGSTSCFTPWLWRKILQREVRVDRRDQRRGQRPVSVHVSHGVEGQGSVLFLLQVVVNCRPGEVRPRRAVER